MKYQIFYSTTILKQQLLLNFPSVNLVFILTISLSYINKYISCWIKAFLCKNEIVFSTIQYFEINKKLILSI